MTIKSVVVVDRSGKTGSSFWDCLSGSGITAHVFGAFGPALELLQRNRVDTAVVEFDVDKETHKFCREVALIGVPIVFSSAPLDYEDSRRQGFPVSFPNLPKAPTMTVPYLRI